MGQACQSAKSKHKDKQPEDHPVSPTASQSSEPQPMKKSILKNEQRADTALIRQQHLEFMDACFKGQKDRLLSILKQNPNIGKEISVMKGNNEKQIFEWNPILLAVAREHKEILEVLFEHDATAESFHQINCLQKPYDIDTQKKKVYDHQKRIKRECFALKLSILNQDIETFKYIWNENNLLWNMGHYFIHKTLQYIQSILCYILIVLRAMMKYNGGWEQGIRCLVSSPTSKVIFLSSVSNVDKFIDTVDVLQDQIRRCEQINMPLARKYKELLLTRPYILYCFFLELSKDEGQDDDSSGGRRLPIQQKLDVSYLRRCLHLLQSDDIHMLHTDIDEIFSIFIIGTINVLCLLRFNEFDQNADEANERNARLQIKDEFFAKFEDRDEGVQKLLQDMTRIFENERSVDKEEYLDIVQELDLFLFREITVRNKRVQSGKARVTNVLVEAMHCGFENVIDYIFSQIFFIFLKMFYIPVKKYQFSFSQNDICSIPSSFGTILIKYLKRIFSEGFSNIRAILKVNNHLEIDNEVALFNTSYFLTHIDSNLPFLKKLYFNLIDLMQLSNFLEIFSYAIKGSFGESMTSNLSATQNQISSGGGPPINANHYHIFEFILTNIKFQSLFNTSLELQKFIFIRELLTIAEDNPQCGLIQMLKGLEPYKMYTDMVKQGNTGEEYAEKTKKHLMKLQELKIDCILMFQIKNQKSSAQVQHKKSPSLANRPSQSQRNSASAMQTSKPVSNVPKMGLRGSTHESQKGQSDREESKKGGSQKPQKPRQSSDKQQSKPPLSQQLPSRQLGSDNSLHNKKESATISTGREGSKLKAEFKHEEEESDRLTELLEDLKVKNPDTSHQLNSDQRGSIPKSKIKESISSKEGDTLLSIDELGRQILGMIKNNREQEIKKALLKHKINDVQYIKSIQNFDEVPIKGEQPPILNSGQTN